MAATEKAELVAHETDRWLNGHQEFDNLELVHSLVSEAEVGWSIYMCPCTMLLFIELELIVIL